MYHDYQLCFPQLYSGAQHTISLSQSHIKNMILLLQKITDVVLFTSWLQFCKSKGKNQMKMTEGEKQLETVLSHFPAVTPVTCLPSGLSSVSAEHWACSVNRKGRDSDAMRCALRAFTLPWPCASWPKQISIWNTWWRRERAWSHEMIFTDFSFNKTDEGRMD